MGLIYLSFSLFLLLILFVVVSEQTSNIGSIGGMNSKTDSIPKKMSFSDIVVLGLILIYFVLNIFGVYFV